MLGTARDTLKAIRIAAAEFRWNNRLAQTTPLTFVAPAWVRDAMAADLTFQAPGDDALNTSFTEVDSWFGEFNVDAVWSNDNLTHRPSRRRRRIPPRSTSSSSPLALSSVSTVDRSTLAWCGRRKTFRPTVTAPSPRRLSRWPTSAPRRLPVTAAWSYTGTPCREDQGWRWWGSDHRVNDAPSGREQSRPLTTAIGRRISNGS